MRLRSLEIQGFKSFPDKTRLEFDGGITAVVGPNGSGKSNIADAVRWVLGEQSTKNLRGGKMEDVIFGGTQTRKPQGFALVQLTIDNADRALPYEGDVLTISRRLYRSGESEYRIGGSAVRLKDIHQLLMDTGLGRDGYSIIGQGRIAEIVSAKSRERREIFEEAAGIAKYRYRKEEAEKKLAGAEENLVRLRDILQELEGRVGPLRLQSEKAKEFLTLSGEKRSLEISLWLLDLARYKEQLKAQEDKIYICKNQYEDMELESSKIEEEMNAVYAKTQQLSMQTEESRAQIRRLEEQLAKGDSDRAVLQNDIQHNEATVERLRGELEGAGADSDTVRKILSDKEAQLQRIRQDLEAMAGRIEAAQQRMEEQREQAARVEAEIAGLTSRRATLSESLNRQQMEQASSETLRTESQSRMEALRRNSAGHRDLVVELTEALEECIQQQNEQQERVEGLQNTLKGHQIKRQSRQGKVEELLQKRGTLETQRGQKIQRAKVLEDLERNMEGFAHSVKYILGQVERGSLGGVFGPVSSLISVPQRYALAIETALGGALQNIVVKDETVAKTGIRLLKSSGSGRATFLPLTSVRGKVMDAGQASRQEGFVGVASRLVEADPRFSGVVDQLLGRVCIVEDLDAGTQIAKAAGYSFRIVTLDGQVINAGGSFTGGSTGKNTGVLSRRSEIEKLRGEAGQLQGAMETLDGEIKAAQEELSAVDAYIAGAESEMQTAREEHVRLGFSREQLEKNLSQAKTGQQDAEREIRTLAARLEEIASQTSSASQMMEEITANIVMLDRELAAAANRREQLSQGTANAGEALNEQRLARLAAEKDYDSLEADILQTRDRIEGFGNKSRQLRDQMDGMIKANSEIQERIANLEADKEKLQGQIAALTESIQGWSETRTALEASTTQLRQREREISAKKEGVSRELARLEERKKVLQSDCDSIVAKLWDEYELTRSQAQEEAVEIPDRDRASRRLQELRGKIRSLGTVNVAAIAEYEEVSQRFEFLSVQVADVEESKAQLLELITSLTQEMREIFADNFGKIAHHFSRIFVQLFGGGKGELTLTQDADVLEAGVEIHVQPPGKVIKNLTLLSGGEQAFVAIAIYFAILKVRPAPFCLLDEIEAALDDVNVVKFASFLRQMSGNTQFIAITHRRGTMEEADVLYGVTMQDEGVSKLLELKVSEVESKLGMAQSG